MTHHRLEVADVFRSHSTQFLTLHGSWLSTEQRRALTAIAHCRTAALGGHVEACEHCGQQRIAYNSCRNRHCPKCQAAARKLWMDQRAAELLPVPYFHVVFTLPQAIAPLALQNPRLVYGLLFETVAATLLQIAADPQHLGARIGFLAILHTWGQNLMHHPHLHCVVPGGGFSANGARWIACRKNYFLPVRVLSRVFRGKFIDALKRAYRRGALKLNGSLTTLNQRSEFERWLTLAVRTDWVVHAKPPFGGPEQVLKYLARYTHRVAISNDRLISLNNGQVQFQWKDYSQNSARKTMTVSATEFMRRFFLHVLPRGFVKIRHFGFLANRVRSERIALGRRLLGVASAVENHNCTITDQMPTPQAVDPQSDLCPACRQGRLLVIEILLPQRVTIYSSPIPTVAPWDTS